MVNKMHEQAPTKGSGKRTFEKKKENLEEWEPVEYESLKVGDVFRFSDIVGEENTHYEITTVGRTVDNHRTYTYIVHRI